MIRDSAFIILLSTIVAATGLASALEKPLSQAQGLAAPTEPALLRAALAAQRPVLVHFTGDAGADNVRQILVIDRLKSRFFNRVTFIQAVDETPEGDAAFEAFGVTKIPSVAILSPTGEIVAGFEGFADAVDLETALRRALLGGTGGKLAASGEGAGPGVQVGAPAPASTATVEAALSAAADGQPVVLFFHAEWSPFSREQAGVIQALAQELFGKIQVLTLRDGVTEDAQGLADYDVYSFPTLVVVGPDRRIRQIMRNETDLATLREALGGAPAPP